MPEVDSGVPRQWLDPHPDLGKLAGAATLLLMAVFGVGLLANGFAERNFWLPEVYIHIEPTLEATLDHLEMQLALTGNDQLSRLHIADVKESRIFLVQGGKAFSKLVLIALGGNFESAMDVRLRVFHRRQLDLAIGAAQGIPGMGVLQFNHDANIARANPVNSCAFMSLQVVHLTDLFRALPVGVVHFHALADLARVVPAKR